MSQALLIFDAPENEKVISGIAELVSVTQRLPPRLAIVEGQPDQLASVRGLPRISMFEGPVPENILQQLNPTERLFAEAWAHSRQPKTNRVGEGLSWDAEGFEPPNGKHGA